jgi:hypothetical protein
MVVSLVLLLWTEASIGQVLKLTLNPESNLENMSHQALAQY